MRTEKKHTTPLLEKGRSSIKHDSASSPNKVTAYNLPKTIINQFFTSVKEVFTNRIARKGEPVDAHSPPSSGADESEHARVRLPSSA